MALAEDISAVARGVQDEVSRGIPEEELVSFYRTLRTLSARFEALAGESKGE